MQLPDIDLIAGCARQSQSKGGRAGYWSTPPGLDTTRM